MQNHKHHRSTRESLECIFSNISFWYARYVYNINPRVRVFGIPKEYKRMTVNWRFISLPVLHPANLSKPSSSLISFGTSFGLQSYLCLSCKKSLPWPCRPCRRLGHRAFSPAMSVHSKLTRRPVTCSEKTGSATPATGSARLEETFCLEVLFGCLHNLSYTCRYNLKEYKFMYSRYSRYSVCAFNCFSTSRNEFLMFMLLAIVL